MAVKRKTDPVKFAELGVAPKELLRHYRDMLLIRRFEERAGQMYGMGLIGGFCHLYIGQEAVVVGMQAALKEGDTIVTSYRDHGHMLACGMDPKGVMAELTGRRSGYSRGKGGSMHMFSREKDFFGGHGIVGAQVPVGTGLAFAHHYRGNGLICVTYLGDGAINQGQVYESFNMASLWKLPIVYAIENNRYGMGTSIDRASARTDLFHRGMAYGIPGEQVGIEVIGLKLGNLQVKLLALRANRFEIGVRGADLPRQAQPPDQAAVAFDQVIKKIAGQGDANNRANNIMRPPLQFAQYDHWSAP